MACSSSLAPLASFSCGRGRSTAGSLHCKGCSNRTRAALSRYFRWLADRDVIAASPCVGIAAPTRETPRERVLSDAELHRLWLAAEAIGGPVGACIKLLILTGQRRR